MNRLARILACVLPRRLLAGLAAAYQLRRCDEIREEAFPRYTCPASRHAQLIADELLSCIVPDPIDAAHSAGSIAATVAALWRLRQEAAGE